MWISSPLIASQRARAIVVLPVPLGPVKRNAALRGLRAKLAIIRLGRSRPINSAIVFGRYFSDSGSGNAKEGVLIAHPRLAERRPVSRCFRHTTIPDIASLAKLHGRMRHASRTERQRNAKHRVSTSP